VMRRSGGKGRSEEKKKGEEAVWGWGLSLSHNCLCCCTFFFFFALSVVSRGWAIQCFFFDWSRGSVSGRFSTSQDVMAVESVMVAGPLWLPD
jgi:hypothetical protein